MINNITGDEVEINLTVEVDEGRAFIALADDDENTIDLCVFDPNEVDDFFKRVAEIKEEWERVYWDNRRSRA
jgi:hypothetical protein